MKWLANTGGKYFLVALFAVSALLTEVSANDAKQAGVDSGNAALGKFGSKEGIKSNISNPMTSSNTQMTTIDNSKSFNAQLSCPSSKEFLNVLVQPGTTGDLATVIVGQDINMDGTTDYSYQVPFPVSGVCANGVISCDVGTWDNCRHYKWIADSQSQSSLQEVTLKDLGGCYCINNNCGNNLVWTNLSLILKDIGGGVAGAVQGSNPKFAISDVKIDGTVITYYGQNVAECFSGSSLSSFTQYYSNPAIISGDVESQVLTQSQDPDSYYSMLKNSIAMENRAVNYVPCDIRRVVSCIAGSTDYSESISNLCSSMEADSKCKLKEEVVDDVKTYKNYNPTLLTPLQSCRSLTCQAEATCNNDIVYDSGAIGEDGCKSEGLPVEFYRCDASPGALPNKCTDWDSDANECRCTSWSDPVYDADGNIITPATCLSRACADTSPRLSYTTYVVAGNALTVTAHQWLASSRGSCGGYYFIGIFDSSGTLVSKKWNDSNLGCGTFDNSLVYIPTVSDNYTVKIWLWNHASYGGSNCQGVVRKIKCPLDETLQCIGDISSGSICTKIVTHNICKDWWDKERTYLCDTGQSFDFSDAQKRLERITSTTADNTTTMYYQDLRKDDSGNWISEEKTLELPSRDSYSDCETVCKTRKSISDTQVAQSGHTGQTRTTTQGYDFYYKSCINSTCPLDVGEEIVKDCQCINDFAEAAVIMQTLRLAGQDLICSSGVSKPLQ